MTTRNAILLLIAALAILALAACGGKQTQPKQWTFPIPEPDYNTKLGLDFSPFEEAMATLTDERRAELDQFLNQSNIVAIQDKLAKGELSSEELTIYYLDRIKRYDVGNFNSVLALNPNVLEEARARDAERANGQTNDSLMHGIPVLLKNNIAIKGMTTAAGAVAMKDWKPERDAALVASLRKHGAVILGHANLSEWANYMDKDMPSGFSTLGGQTRNPYGPFDTLGSSSGSAVAAAANFATVTIGTETQGSLLAPANNNSAVAMKPTHGLVSGDYIIPLMPFQDDAGPMGRNVIDVAILLTAMIDPDSSQAGTNYAEAIGNSLNEDTTLRLGMTVDNEPIRKALEEAGFEVVLFDREDLFGVDQFPGIVDIIPATFKYAINDFLPAVNAPMKSLDEVVAFNKEDMANRAPYGQDYLEDALASKESKEENQKQIQDRIQANQALLTNLFDKYQVDVVFDSSNYSGSPLLQTYAPAGWPAMVISAGYGQDGMPQSLGFVARPNMEKELLITAFKAEQVFRAWQPPNLDATIQMLDEKLGDKK